MYQNIAQTLSNFCIKEMKFQLCFIPSFPNQLPPPTSPLDSSQGPISQCLSSQADSLTVREEWKKKAKEREKKEFGGDEVFRQWKEKNPIFSKKEKERS